MNAPLCSHCGKRIPHRVTVAGVPMGSHTLAAIDKQYYFCSLRCAARFGVSRAPTFHFVSEREALRAEDRRRWETRPKQRVNPNT